MKPGTRVNGGSRVRALWSALALLAAPAPAPADVDPLAEKAGQFRAALVERHISPEGVVLYKIDLDRLPEARSGGRYPSVSDTPMFNGIWAATSCLRASLVRGPEREEALHDAGHALAGLELLMGVTGRRGLLARLVRHADAPREASEARQKWYPGASGYENYRWRGEVSVDQYASGLLVAVWECREFFPARSRELVTAFADHLLAHDLEITDADGARTRFGDLSPRSGYGWNSIAQLTAYASFALAAELGSNPAHARERDRLRDERRVVARSRTTNVRIGAITNHSNDLMAWSLLRVLVPLARETGDPALVDLRHAMYLAWFRVRNDGNALFAGLFCQLDPEACDRAALEQARALLARFPLDKQLRGPDPRVASLPRRLIPGRKWRPLARDLVPIELRTPSSYEWKSSPYRVDGTAHPGKEYTGLDYLSAYWVLRAVDSAAR